MSKANDPIEEIFERALGVEPALRGAFLDQVCAGDGELRRRLDQLFSAAERRDGFLPATSPGVVLPTLIEEPEALEREGVTIGRYKLLQKIGEGGMGVVYMAEQTEPVTRKVALKIIRLGMDTRQVVARFEAERQALAMMEHPHIARVLDAGSTESGRPFFVMELVRGVPITEYCEKNKLGTRDRLQLFIPVCEAIQHAHQKGIIHRDIKPSNVLVTLQDGVAVPKVIDFGIAKAVHQKLTEKTLCTQYAQLLGTPAYMSPEQAEMGGMDIDTRSDIYSLGVLLYELLTGRPPFDPVELLAAGLDAMRQTIREKEPVRPSTRVTELKSEGADGAGEPEIRGLVHALRGDLDWVVMQCLEKDRTRRYPTASGLASDLLRYLGNEPVEARPPSALYRMGKAWRRHRLVLGAAASVAVVLMASVVLLGLSSREEKRARIRAEAAEVEQGRERAKAEAALERAANEARQAEEARQRVSVERDRAARLLSISQAEQGTRLLEAGNPAGLLHLVEARRVVDHLPEERIARTMLWSGWFEGTHAANAVLLPTTNVLGSVTYSPDGRWIATGTAEGDGLLWDVRTATQAAVIPTGWGERFGPPPDAASRDALKRAGIRPVPVPRFQFGAKGRLLAVMPPRGQLWDLAPVASNRPPRLLLDHAVGLAFNPDRTRVVTLGIIPGRRTEREVQVWDEASAEPFGSPWLGTGLPILSVFALSPDASLVAVGGDFLTLRRADTGEPIKPILRAASPSDPTLWSRRLQFTPDGRSLLEGSGNGIQRYDTATGEAMGPPSPDRWMRYADPIVGGHWLTVERDQGVQLVMSQSGEALGPVVAVGGPANLPQPLVAWSPEGAFVASVGTDDAIRLWSATGGDAWWRPIGQATKVAALSVGPSGEQIAVLTPEGTCRLLSPIPANAGQVGSWHRTRIVGFDGQGRLIAFALTNQALIRIDPASGAVVGAPWPMPGGEPLIGAALNRGRDRLATVSGDGKSPSRVRMWHTETGRGVDVEFPVSDATHLAFSWDGRMLAGVSAATGSVEIWETATGRRLAKLKWPDSQAVPSTRIQFNPDGRYLATWSPYGQVFVWNIKTPAEGFVLREGQIRAISPDWSHTLSPFGLVDSSNPDQGVLAAHQLPPALNQSMGWALFSADARWLALGGRDGMTRLWSVAGGRSQGQTIRGGQTFRGLEFTPDGRLLITAESGTGALDAWDVSTGLRCGPPVPVNGAVIAHELDPAGRFIAVTLQDTRTEIWRLPSRDIPLDGMQQATWHRTGARLDAVGQVEIIPAAEILKTGVEGRSIGPGGN